jgi:hypothetical protein
MMTLVEQLFLWPSRDHMKGTELEDNKMKTNERQCMMILSGDSEL